MKSILASSLVTLALVCTDALADCSTNQVTGSAINTLLSGSLVCGRPAAGYGGSTADRWQEEHQAGGQLFDYKRGPGDPVDPREQVGTWASSGNSVTYTYGSGTVTYDGLYQVTGSTYSFCQGTSEIVRANITNPNPGSGCGGVFP